MHKKYDRETVVKGTWGNYKTMDLGVLGLMYPYLVENHKHYLSNGKIDVEYYRKKYKLLNYKETQK